jgi:serine protease Do
MRRSALGAVLLVAAAAAMTFTAVPLHGRQPADPPDSSDEDVVRKVQRLHPFRMFDHDGAQIGVSIRDPEAGAGAGGAVVEDVRDESPAARAGIKDGDVITEFDGERVRSARQLARLVSETPAGRSVPVTVMRGDSRMDVQVTPEAGRMAGEFAAPPVRIEGMPHLRFEEPPAFEWMPREGARVWAWSDRMDRGRLGVAIQSLTPQLAEFFGTKDGVLVTTVREESPAARAGIKAGDVITSIDGKPVGSPRDLIEAIRGDASADVKISYVRDRKSVDVQVKLPEGERQRERRSRSARPA